MTKLFKAVQEYLSMRNQLGFKLSEAKSVLYKFAVFSQSKRVSHITSKVALEFAMQNKNSSTAQWATRLSIIRRFALHLQQIDPLTEVPPPHLLPYSYQRRSPYIYSDNDIFKLLKSCNILSSHPLTAKTYYTLLGLIAVTGMRTNEALLLERDSVDLTLGILTIRDSKFRKIRKIPIHTSTIEILRSYVSQRDQYFSRELSSYFFVNERGLGLKPDTVRKIFIKICIKAGLRKSGQPGGPRIIDFRHTLAVKTLVRCYQEGLNVNIVIPVLATYLGHENPVHTYWYLTAVPELLSLINDRLEKKFGGK